MSEILHLESYFDNRITLMRALLLTAGMKMLSTDSLMKSTLLLHMNGGKGQCIVYYQCLLTLVPGPGNNGVGEIKSTGFRSMSSLSMTILVYDPADHEHYTKA